MRQRGRRWRAAISETMKQLLFVEIVHFCMQGGKQKEPEDTAEEKKAVAKGIRAAKEREAAIRSQGVSGGKAGKLALSTAQPGDMPKKKKDSKKRQRCTCLLLLYVLQIVLHQEAPEVRVALRTMSSPLC